MFVNRTARKVGQKYRCAVPGCESNSHDNLDVSFHGLPAPNKRQVPVTDYFGNRVMVDQLFAWTTALKVPNKLSHHWKICSRHFKREDYSLPNLPTICPTLLRTAVPSLNLPGTDPKKIQKSEMRLKRRLGRGKRESKSNPKNNACDSEETELSSDKNISNQPVTSISGMTGELVTDQSPDTDASNVDDTREVDGGDNIIDHCYCARPPCELPSNACDVASGSGGHEEPETDNSISAEQANIDSEVLTPDHEKANTGDDERSQQVYDPESPVKKRKLRLLEDITTDKQMSSVCGIESLQLFNSIVECVKFATKNRWEKDGLIMNTAERVLMVYVKLKQKPTFSFLAFTFRPLSQTHCTRIFFETLKVLSKCMKVALPWPSKEEVLSNLPQCFQNFENTRVIVDCTEIFVQCPRKTCCQIHLYSYYKGSYTLKVMIGISPAGNITFISKAYGRRWSDSAIFEQSELIDLLEPGDALMADKGFLIDELCHRKKIHLIRPPFKRGKQLSQKDANSNVEIAKARVHVERINQRIKVFEILGEKFPISLLPHFEDILTVICGTVNLSSPIIGDALFMKND